MEQAELRANNSEQTTQRSRQAFPSLERGTRLLVRQPAFRDRLPVSHKKSQRFLGTSAGPLACVGYLTAASKRLPLQAVTSQPLD